MVGGDMGLRARIKVLRDAVDKLDMRNVRLRPVTR
jgi:hypothetical protein